MLETAIKKLTDAVEELTATIKGSAPSSVTVETPAPSPAPSAAAAEPTKQDAPPAPEPTPETPSEPAAASDITKQMLAEATIEVARKKGREAAVSILAKYGASKVPELKDPGVWPQVYADLQKALA